MLARSSLPLQVDLTAICIVMGLPMPLAPSTVLRFGMGRAVRRRRGPRFWILATGAPPRWAGWVTWVSAVSG